MLLLCGVHLLHNIGSILAVRARLDVKIVRDRPVSESFMWRAAALWQIAPVLALWVLVHWSEMGLALAIALTCAAHVIDLVRIRDREELAKPLRTVGFRALALSIAFSILVLAALW